MRSVRTLAPLLLAGCHAIPVVRVDTHADDLDDASAWLEDAADAFGDSIIISVSGATHDAPASMTREMSVSLLHGAASGSISIWFVEDVAPEDGDDGWANVAGVGLAGGCAGMVAVEVGAMHTILAHEIGHALGLDHVRDKGNIMQPYPWGEGLTAPQLDSIADAAYALSVCEKLQL